MAMRLILGAIPSTPIHSIQAELALRPLKYEASLAVQRVVVKLLHLKNNSTVKSLRDLSNNLSLWNVEPRRNLLIQAIRKWDNPEAPTIKQETSANEIPINLAPIILGATWTHFRKSELPPQSQRWILDLLHSTSATHEKLYTDASKQHNGATGAAVYIPASNKAHIKRLPDTFSIFAAEALAIHMALSTIQIVLACLKS
jgi:hypothetical protein